MKAERSGKTAASQAVMTQEWTLHELGELLTERKAKIVPKIGDSRPYVALEHMAQGEPHLIAYGRANEATSAKSIFQKGDILFGKLRPNLKKCLRAPIDGVCSTDIIVLSPKKGHDPAFLTQLLHGHRVMSYAMRNGFGTKMPRVSWEMLAEVAVRIPEHYEQTTLASMLDAIDVTKAQSQSIAIQSMQTKAALMQGLLLPNSKTRTKFKVHALGELFAERKESGKPGLPTLSVTMHDGMVDREEHGRRVESELTPEEHLLARKHDIAYNMMRMWQGVSGLAPFTGLVSPAYVVLKPLAGIDPLFGSYLFKLPETIRLFHRYSQGLTNDRLRLYYDQFAEIRVPIPSDIKEQRRIASLLITLDRQIEQSESLVQSLRQTKAAICQQLFS